jgi:hypothetical protein
MAFLPGLIKAAKGFKGTVVGKIFDKVGGQVVSSLPGGKQLQAAGRAVSSIFAKPGTAAGVAAAAGIGTGAGIMSMAGGGAPGGALMQGGQLLPPIIDSTLLRPYYRAPRGYVIVRDPSSGEVYGMLKAYARANHFWKPSRRPPISAGDWHKYQTAKAVEKRLMKIARSGLRHHSRPQQISGRKGR